MALLKGRYFLKSKPLRRKGKRGDGWAERGSPTLRKHRPPPLTAAVSVDGGAGSREDVSQQVKTRTQSHKAANNRSPLAIVINSRTMGPYKDKQNGLENERQWKLSYIPDR